VNKTIFFLMAASLCLAQQSDEKPRGPRYYRLDFAVKELEGGKVQSTKAYSVIGSTTGGGNSQIRSGDKVPITSATDSRQFQFFDVGVNIDCKLQFETPTDLAMQISADISSVNTASTAPAPVVDQTKWNSNVVVALKKTTTIFSSESPGSKRTTQLDLTVTPLP
jgi:hypothetical protein